MVAGFVAGMALISRRPVTFAVPQPHSAAHNVNRVIVIFFIMSGECGFRSGIGFEMGSATVPVAALGVPPRASPAKETSNDASARAVGRSAGRRPVHARRARSPNDDGSKILLTLPPPNRRRALCKAGPRRAVD